MTLEKIKSLNVPMARKLELAVDELLRVSKTTPVKTKRDVAIVEQVRPRTEGHDRAVFDLE